MQPSSPFLKALLTVTLILLSVLWTRAGVVFEQPHNGSGALRTSSRYQPNGTDYDQFVWDSFSVPTAQAVTEIRWRGGYDPQLAYWGGNLVNFRVSIYESTPGLSQPLLGPGYPGTPATLVAYDTGDKAGETSAGVFGGVEMFDYHFVLPTVFQAQAGKLYWIQIEAEFTGGLPYWGFAAGTGNGSYFRRIAGQADFYFQYAPGDAAFSIVTTDGPIYTVAASASPAGSGTIANTGLYPNNSAAPLIATPNAGYAFVNWTDNGTVVSTASNYTFTVTGNRTLVANFSSGSTITTVAAPLTGGTTNGDGSFANGSTRTVEAVPSANYSFVNWTENGVQVSTNAFYTFTVTANRNLVANFTPTATNLGIVFSQPPANSGTLLNSSYLAPDGNVDGMEYRFEKFTCFAPQNISHLRWRGGYAGNNRATNPVTDWVIQIYGSIPVGSQPDLGTGPLKTYEIAGNANETAAEVVGGVQMYDYSLTLPTSFQAQAGVGYWVQIEAWQHGYPLTWGNATGIGGNGTHFRRLGNSYYGGTGDLAITLSAATPTNYAIAAPPSSVAGGSVTGGGTYALNETATVSASAKAGFAFVNWTEGGVAVSSSALYQFPATANRTLVANFQPTYQLALASSSTTMGTVAGAGTFLIGTNVTATATAKPGYVFVKWTEAGTTVSTSPSYTFSILAQRSLLANFAVGFTMTATSSFAPGGTVIGAGGYATGNSGTLVATPAVGYQFRNWTEAGVVVGSDTTYNFTATSNRTLVANFLPIVDIGNVAPGTHFIVWPASAAGWALQESPDLSAGSWFASNEPISVSGGNNQIVITFTSGNRFFRLRHP
ncbi:MAG: hypothetical protein ABMA01_06145 [Chthoniobacteraceae bacterium]